jgi:hypothetical protein
VTLDFAPPVASAVAEEPARLSIVAELRRDKKIGELTVAHVELIARGDAELKNLIRTRPAALSRRVGAGPALGSPERVTSSAGATPIACLSRQAGLVFRTRNTWPNSAMRVARRN